MKLLSRRDSRKNHTMRSIVNFGIVLAKEDIENAAAYLAEHNVPLHVAHRVLLGNPKPMEWTK